MAFTFVNGLLIGISITVTCSILRNHIINGKKESKKMKMKIKIKKIPDWLLYLTKTKSEYKRVLYREFEDIEWRKENGWHGNDLIHSESSNAVYISHYFYSEKKKQLIGIVHFGPNAESHRGFCHGGAMTSCFDDILGHIAFVYGKQPWCGCTAQIDCTLKMPVKVGQILKVTATIMKQERRKLFVNGSLEDEQGNVYALLKGLSISNVYFGDYNDQVSKRMWVEDHTTTTNNIADNAVVIKDTGWFM